MTNIHNDKKKPTAKDFTDYQIADHGGLSRNCFLSLPAEIRNEIYAACLVASGFVRISCNSSRMNGVVSAYSLDRSANRTSMELGYQLLSTCTTIRDEATPVLYGMNIFGFQEYDNPLPFLKNIGGSVQHIRRIFLYCQPTQNFRQAVTLLSKAKNLETVSIRCTGIPMAPREMAEVLRPLYETVQKTSKRGEHRSVQEVLVLPTDTRLGYWPKVRELLGDDMR